MNVAKYNLAESGHLCTHYARGATHYSNSDVALDKSNHNYNLAPEREYGQVEHITSTLSHISHSNRKDLVVMADWVITMPKEIINLPIDDHELFFKATYDFLSKRYGQLSGLGNDVVVSSFVHLDETTPHMHFAFMPVISKGDTTKFCAKEVICRRELQKIHKELQAYLDDHLPFHVDVNNGGTLKDDNGRVINSVADLKKYAIQSRNRVKELENENELLRNRLMDVSKEIDHGNNSRWARKADIERVEDVEKSRW